MSFKHLTPDDLDLHGKTPGFFGAMPVAVVDHEVTRFVEGDFMGQRQPQFPLWLAEGLVFLSEGAFSNPFEATASVNPILTRESVIEALNKQWQDDYDEELDWWKNDFKHYCQCGHGNAKPDVQPAHPWDVSNREETTVRCRLWLSLTPYRVWACYMKAKQAGQEVFNEEMLSFVQGNGNPDRIEKAVTRAFEEAVLATVKELKA